MSEDIGGPDIAYHQVKRLFVCKLLQKKKKKNVLLVLDSQFQSLNDITLLPIKAEWGKFILRDAYEVARIKFSCNILIT